MATNAPAAKKRRITLSIDSQEDGDFRQIDLSRENAELAGMYLQYVATGKEPSHCGCTLESYQLFIELYLLGRRISDNAFCNAVIAAFCRALDGEAHDLTSDHVNYIYERTPVNSPLRRLAVAVWTDGQADCIVHWKEHIEGLSSDFVYDMLRQFAKLRKGSEPVSYYDKQEEYFR